jgi:hypothetical protein
VLLVVVKEREEKEKEVIVMAVMMRNLLSKEKILDHFIRKFYSVRDTDICKLKYDSIV